MKTSHIALAAVLTFASAGAFAQSTSITPAAQSGSLAASQSGSGAAAVTGPITFNSNSTAPETYKNSSVSTTPTIYVPPSMFGGQNNCGMSDSAGAAVTGFGIGISKSSESAECNTREDTGIAYKLGFKDVAVLRFFCFGGSDNRKAYEAAGNKCPDDSTAKGLAYAPTTQLPFQNTKTAQGTNMPAREYAIRKQANYWGNDPIVMHRLGIAG